MTSAPRNEAAPRGGGALAPTSGCCCPKASTSTLRELLAAHRGNRLAAHLVVLVELLEEYRELRGAA